jgi:predicted lysophospholipase L1 biosynthesis ABC-type transport system permease subunit
MTPGTAAVRAWLRLDLRRRWRSLAVLALLVAVASATVFTAVAGARRAESAFDRLGERTRLATAAVLPNQPDFDWDEVRALPEVESLTTFGLTGAAYVVEGRAAAAETWFPFGDADGFTTEEPVVLQGRLPDQSRADEAAVTAGFVQDFGVGVGDTVPIRLPSVDQQQRAGKGESVGPPAGPLLMLRVVGVVRSRWYSDQPGTKGGLLTTFALTQQYRGNLVSKESFFNALVRLRGGEADLPALRAGVARVSGRTDINIWNLREQDRGMQRTVVFEARSLLAFGLAALVAAAVLIGQAVARYVGASIEELAVLRALGMTPRQSLQAAAAGPVLAAAVGAAVAAGVAVAASAWFPLGLAALLEPEPGVAADWTVLAPGVALVVGLVLAGGAGSAWLVLGAGRGRAVGRTSSVATAVTRAGLPVPLVVGTRLALETGRGKTALPVRPALVGVVTGVLGILGAFTFSTGVADAAATPARFGQTFSIGAFLGANGQDYGPVAQVLASVAPDPDVTGVGDLRVSVAESAADNIPVTLYSHGVVGGKPLPTVITEGRMPATAHEVALAPQAASRLGLGIGAKVELKGSRDAAEHSLTVTGIGFVPIGPHNDHADGGWLTTEGYDALFTGFQYHLAALAVRPGADVAVVAARVNATASAAAGGAPVAFEVSKPPPAMALLRQVQVLPVLLGIFLAVLAVGAVGHALATAVRRRRHDLAVLRALGMTRWQTRGVVVTQATVLALVGLVFGVPLGVALGRSVWRVVADYTPLQYEPPVAFWALLLVGPLALLLSNLLAAWPGQVAVRQRISHVLRTE